MPLPLFERLARRLRALTDALRRTWSWRPAPAGAPDAWLEGRFAHRHRTLDYRLFVPARGAGRPRALLLMLHGCTQNPDDFAAGTRMNRLASEHGVLVLYPTQTEQAHPARCWNWFLPQHQQRERGEPALLAALVQSVMDMHAADPARVYVAGLSAGGAMAAVLAHTHPDLFAAIGVHSGLPCGVASDLVSALSAMQGGPGGAGTALGPAMPAIVFDGDADDRVNPRNGVALVAAAIAAQPQPPGEAREARGEVPHGRAYTRHTYGDARGRIAVEHWVVHGAGHAWSGGSADGSYTDPAGPDASAQMLRFFLSTSRKGRAGLLYARTPEACGSAPPRALSEPGDPK